MTTMTLSQFAKQIGFNRASDKRFKELLRSWQVQGHIRIYQGGYAGDSMHHPKKVQISKTLSSYQESAKTYSRTKTEKLLNEFGFQTRRAEKVHNCLTCAGKIFPHELYHTKRFFTANICLVCAEQIMVDAQATGEVKLIIKVKRFE